MRRLLTKLLLLSAFTASAQYDAAGVDPLYLHLQPNPYARLLHGATPYPSTPNRTEYYPSVTGAPGFPIALTWDQNYSKASITGGKMITPTQAMMHVPQVWKRGITGAGVKVAVLDLGYSPAHGHDAITVTKAYNPVNPDSVERNTYGHSTAVIGCLAARNNGTSDMLGVAYDALVYSYAGDEFYNLIDRARLDGCRIITSSLTLPYTPEMIGAVQRLHDAGGILILAAGNDRDSAEAMVDGCKIPWTVCVGGTLGGGVLAFSDSFYAKQVLPVNGKALDFALPYWTIAPGFPQPDPVVTPVATNAYGITGGTSFDAPQLAGALALLKQKFPRLPLRALYWMLKTHSRPLTALGITTYIPNLDFIK